MNKNKDPLVNPIADDQNNSAQPAPPGWALTNDKVIGGQTIQTNYNTPQLTLQLTHIKAITPSRLAKQYSWADGELVKESAGQLIRGVIGTD